MMKIKEMWSVRLVNGHGLGFFENLAYAQIFSASEERETMINKVIIHEMVS